MLVLGDSHTRAFGASPNFTPVFLGPGKDRNFIDWSNVDALHAVCDRIEEKLHPERVLLCLGEPDTRYALGLGWQPWRSVRPKDECNHHFVRACALRYVAFIREVEQRLGWSVFVQNVVLTQDPVQCDYIDLYNDVLRKELGERVIEFNNRIRAEDGTIERSFSWDWIHANNMIMPFVEERLNLTPSASKPVDAITMKGLLSRNERFNVLQLDTDKASSCIEFLRRLLNR